MSEPTKMNSLRNRINRVDYVQTIMKWIDKSKRVIYINEPNCNLFLWRLWVISSKWTRCCVKRTSSTGSNVHTTGLIIQIILVYLERQRASFTKDKRCKWFGKLFRSIPHEMTKLDIVCDNVPVYVDLDKVSQEDVIIDTTIIRRVSYSINARESLSLLSKTQWSTHLEPWWLHHQQKVFRVQITLARRNNGWSDTCNCPANIILQSCREILWPNLATRL